MHWFSSLECQWGPTADRLIDQKQNIGGKGGTGDEDEGRVIDNPWAGEKQGADEWLAFGKTAAKSQELHDKKADWNEIGAVMDGGMELERNEGKRTRRGEAGGWGVYGGTAD